MTLLLKTILIFFLFFVVFFSGKEKEEEFLINLLLCSLIKSNKMKLISTECCHLCLKFFSLNFDPSNERSNGQSSEQSNERPNEQSNGEMITIQMIEKRCSSVNSILKELKDDKLEINLMFCLFKRLEECMANRRCVDDKEQQNSTNLLLQIEERLIYNQEIDNLKIIYFTQLSFLFELIDPANIIGSYTKIIEFCSILLRSVIQFITITNDKSIIKTKLDHQTDDRTEMERIKNEYDMVHFILSILSMFTSGIIDDLTNVNPFEIRKELKVFLPLIEQLQQLYSQTDIGEMAQNLYINIMTFGGGVGGGGDTNKVLIEEINDTTPEKVSSEYEKAMIDVKDALIPVRAHGIISLRRLIDAQDPQCIKNHQQLLDIFIK
jgi:hypothetical protein